MKAGKSAIWSRLSCPYSEYTLVDLPSSVAKHMKYACVWTTCNKPLNLSNVRRLDMTLPHCSYQYMQCKISIFTLNFAGILGRKMANLMTGKCTTIVFPNNLEEELWSSLHLVMKISVRYQHILIDRFAWCHTHHHQNSRLNVNFDTMSKF